MSLLSALAEFLLACRADGLRPATIRWYTSILTSFAAEFADRPLTAITTQMIREYIVALRERIPYENAPQKPPSSGKLSSSSIASHITALHSFWGWCAREYSITNPMLNIKRPRRQPPQPKAVAATDIVKLLQATGDGVAGVRDRAIICFLADTGCRLGGLLGLKLEHLQIAQHRALVNEKGNRMRMVVFTQYTARMLRNWLYLRVSPSDRVFVSLRTGEALTESGVNQVLKRLKKRANITGRVNPHSFRHGFAREYLTNGGDLATLAKLLGHKNINTTTDYYAVFSEDELAELHEKFSPMNKLKES